MMRRKLVSLIGGRTENTGPQACVLAESVGAELGRRGYGVITGGDEGIAAAASRGCVRAGGETIALLKGMSLDHPCNAYTTWVIPTATELARSSPLLWAGDGVIAFEGRYGTLGEIALALDMGRPLVITGDHPLLNTAAINAPLCRVLPGNDVTASEAVDALEELIRQAPADHHVQPVSSRPAVTRANDQGSC
jgi:uncharacterized protein (TIGR00725 family)